jgi:hypothetical protein
MRFEPIRDQAHSLLKLRRLISRFEKSPSQPNIPGDFSAGGATSPIIVEAARAITMDCEQRDDNCELEAIYNAVKYGTDTIPWLSRGLRYVSDPRCLDTFSEPEALARMCSRGACAGDCLPLDTLVLKNDYQLVELHKVNIGDRIFDGEGFTPIINRWDKGVKPLLEFVLTNGALQKTTPDHRMFKIGRLGNVEEVPASELRANDQLVTGNLIPAGEAGIGTSQTRAFGAALRSKPIALPCALNFSTAEVTALFEGLHAHDGLDSAGSVLKGEIGKLLGAQIRVLYRMIGRGTYLRHTGLPTSPMGVVKQADTSEVRVKAIIGGIEPAPVMDIETESGKFWLPESDLVVHNCDDALVLVGSLCAALGFKVGARAWGPGRSGEYTHVYPVVAVPKHRWPAKGYCGTALDITEPDAYVGWEPNLEMGHIMTAWMPADPDEEKAIGPS